MSTELFALYGGTFSPPHRGHVHAARAFYEAVKPDRLLIIPAATPPHKVPVGGATNADRLRMCQIAFSSIPNTEISDMELKREGKSYTVTTLRELTAKGRTLLFLVGTDMFLTLDRWYLHEEIFALTEIAVMRRESDAALTPQIMAKAEEYRARYHARIRFIEESPVSVSSTELRTAIREGRPCDDLLLPEVAEYIKENGLYRPVNMADVDALREKMSRRIGERRFAHTLGVEETIAELGRRYLPDDVARLRVAALLHDVTKEWDDGAQLAFCEKNGIKVSEAAATAPRVLHALTGAAVAAREFPRLVDSTIYLAIARHTVGAPEMSVFDKLLYLADYIDPTRKYPECIALRRAFFEGYDSATDPLLHLDKILLEAFLATEKEVLARGGVMSPETPATIAALKEAIAGRE